MIPKRGAIALFLTVAGLALLLSFKTPAAPTSASLTVVETAAPTSGSANAIAAAGPTTDPTAAAGRSGTYAGTAVQTRYGTVQVQVTVANGKITDVAMLQYPSADPHSSQISQYALPTLIQETLQAQSSQINSVSGATFTSQGYLQSLQSALDQAAA
jgi:uncharacterized protein with FMN-binding domain